MSYLNTVPLVWGMLHGEQRDLFDLSFCLPSECARRLGAREAGIGIVPVIEMQRRNLDQVPGTGIACRGEVRTILLISRKPFGEIRTLATDAGSRTSVELARIILARRYGSSPVLVSMTPRLESMLEQADAALIIGDAALLLEPSTLPYATLDLGVEWLELTGLPMVFAVWAGPRPLDHDVFRADHFLSSYRFGAARLDDIAEAEYARRGVSREMVHDYLSRNIVFELGEAEYRGMSRYLELAAALPSQSIFQPVREVTA